MRRALRPFAAKLMYGLRVYGLWLRGSPALLAGTREADVAGGPWICRAQPGIRARLGAGAAGNVTADSRQHLAGRLPNVGAKRTSGVCGAGHGRCSYGAGYGVSGHVAGAMAARLVAAGLRVRDGPDTRSVTRGRASGGPVTCDLAAPRSLGAVVEGADLVVHTAAYLGQYKDMAQAVNFEGTRRLTPGPGGSWTSARCRSTEIRSRTGRDPVPYRADPHSTPVPPAADLP